MKKRLSQAYVLFIYLLLYLPIMVLVAYSFNQARFSLQWQGFSLAWYHELLDDRNLWSALMHSIFLALSASFIASASGFLASARLFLYRDNKRIGFFGLLLILIIIPDIVLGVALLIFFNLSQIPLGFFSLLIGHVTFCLPFVILSLHARIKTVDPNIYFSALDLGAKESTALFKILLPMLWPSILSAFLLSFTLSFDDVIISYFIAGPDYSILPLTIFSMVRTGVTPELNALCAFTFLFSMVLVILSYRLSGKNRDASD